MLDPFSLPFFQRGLAEILLLALACGLLGTWIVLRGLAFFAHAVGTATFPGLVLADGLGFSAALGAFGTAFVVAGLVGILARRRATGTDSATALVLAGALALGVILASDVFGSRASVDRLLFGSLLTIDAADMRLAAVAAALVLIAVLALGPRWLATGFTGERGDDARAAGADGVLVLLVAVVAVAALAAAGSLLATAILVVPAATTRLLTARMGTWQLASTGLAAAEGVLGMWLAFQLDVPPGAAIAVLAGAVFALTALVAVARARRIPLAPAVAVLLALAGFALAGCGSAAGGDDGRLRVAATTTQLGDLARQVGGDEAAVTQILSASTDPHEYEPRPSDVQAVADAQVVLASGLGLDAWAADVLGDSGSDATRRGRRRRRADPPPGRERRVGERPALVARPAQRRCAVTRRDRARVHRGGPGARGDRSPRTPAPTAGASCGWTGRSARAWTGSPRRARLIVTDHDALGYFTDRYGVARRRRGDPLADDAGAGLGRRPRGASSARSAARACARCSRRARSIRSSPSGSRRTPAPRRASGSTATRSATRTRRQARISAWRPRTPPRSCAA